MWNVCIVWLTDWKLHLFTVTVRQNSLIEFGTEMQKTNFLLLALPVTQKYQPWASLFCVLVFSLVKWGRHWVVMWSSLTSNTPINISGRYAQRLKEGYSLLYLFSLVKCMELLFFMMGKSSPHLCDCRKSLGSRTHEAQPGMDRGELCLNQLFTIAVCHNSEVLPSYIPTLSVTEQLSLSWHIWLSTTLIIKPSNLFNIVLKYISHLKKYIWRLVFLKCAKLNGFQYWG